MPLKIILTSIIFASMLVCGYAAYKEDDNYELSWFVLGAMGGLVFGAFTSLVIWTIWS